MNAHSVSFLIGAMEFLNLPSKEHDDDDHSSFQLYFFFFDFIRLVLDYLKLCLINVRLSD